MGNKLAFVTFLCLTLFIGIILTTTPIQLAGDIVEYFGITESLINHKSFDLTLQDQQNLEKLLHPEYFNDPTYYISGREGNRYPVHFVFYSFLILPVRLILEFFKTNPLYALPLTNLAIFTFFTAFITFLFLKSSLQKATFLILAYFSPLIWFIAWPGPDVLAMMLLLTTLFFFYHKKYFQAALLAALASWHSQPLLGVFVGILGYYIYVSHQRKKALFQAGGLFILSSLPYLYNLFAFNTLTPWTIFNEGWTVMNGFGIHNASVKKLYEQLLDLNFGIFWYIPVATITGLYFLGKRAVSFDKKSIFILVIFIATAFLYQTNPAWHYGTAGFGPSRHALFLVPLFIFFTVISFQERTKKYLAIMFFFVISQFFILSFNGFLIPNFADTLHHSPYATFTLNNAPYLYNPTPEIFVDRTNHQDLKYPTSAIYTYNGICKKAFLFKMDIQKLKDTCGFIPKEYNEILNLDGAYVNY